MSQQSGKSISKVYLGDGVYASNDDYAIILTTEDGINVTNRIVLGPTEIGAFIIFARNEGYLLK